MKHPVHRLSGLKELVRFNDFPERLRSPNDTTSHHKGQIGRCFLICRHSTASLELLYQARDALYSAASAPGTTKGYEFAAYGSALTSTVSALGWLTTNMADQIRADLRKHETNRHSDAEPGLEEALTHLISLQHKLCAGLQDANAYWDAVGEVGEPK